jgi:hypothetical protein
MNWTPGELLSGIVEQHPVDGLEAIQLDSVAVGELMPGIVYPNQYANHIRLEIDGINLPPAVQIDDPVATDSPIVESQTIARLST